MRRALTLDNCVRVGHRHGMFRSVLRALTLAALAAFSMSGCFGDDVIACEFTTQSRCQERTGSDASTVAATAFRSLCSSSEGTYRDGACPRANIVAGCNVSSNVIDWFYSPLTLDDVRDRGLCPEGEPYAP